MTETVKFQQEQIEWKNATPQEMVRIVSGVISGEYPSVFVEKFISTDGGDCELVDQFQMGMFSNGYSKDEDLLVLSWNDTRKKDCRRFKKFSENDQIGVQDEGGRKAVVLKHESTKNSGEVRVWRFSVVK